MAVEQPHDPSAGDSECPSPEDLAAYLEGTLDPAARDAVEAHLPDCAWCREALADAIEFLDEEEKRLTVVPEPVDVLPFHPKDPVQPAPHVPPVPPDDEVKPFPWQTAAVAVLAAAAVLLLVVRLAPQWLPWNGRGGDGAELQALIAAVAKEPTRPVAGRLTGGFPYAPPPIVTRGTSTRGVSPEVSIAAATIQKGAADDERGREAEGLAHLVIGNAEAAVAALKTAAGTSAGNPDIDANLAAAYIERAESTGRQDLLNAIDAADRALAKNATLPAALFNRALALDRLDDPRAPAAWQAALEAESDPAWRQELTRRLRR